MINCYTIVDARKIKNYPRHIGNEFMKQITRSQNTTSGTILKYLTLERKF